MKALFAFLAAAIAAVFLLSVHFAHAEGVVVGSNGVAFWNANPETDIAGYKVHFGQTSGIYSIINNVGLTATPTSPLVQLSTFGLAEGQWYFAVSAYDLAGNESGLSLNIPFVFDLTAPTDPTGAGVRTKP